MNLTKIFSFLLLVFGLQISTLYAQNNLGFYAGPTAGRFFGFSAYETEFNIKPGIVLGSHYEEKIDSTTYLRFGLQYQYQLADLDIKEYGGHYSGSRVIADYRFNQIRLSIGYGIKLTSVRKVNAQITFGGWTGYNFHSHVKGNAWYMTSASAIDTSGNHVHYTKMETIEFNGRDKKSITPFGAGVYLGWSMAFPVNEKVSFLFHNEYFMSLTNFPSLRKTGGGFLTGVLGFGITYKL